MPKTPMVDIIICSYNNEDIIGKCLDSVKFQSFKDYTCTVVDDNSSDSTVKHVKKSYQWVRVIQKRKNTGPSISRNIGIKATRSRYIATLDSDIVLDKDWLKNMVSFMEKDKDCGIVASKLLLPNKKINATGSSMTKIGIGFDIGANDDTKMSEFSGRKILSTKNHQPMAGGSFEFSKQKQVLYACSAAMIIKREMIDKIGAFDEKYFYGYEDADLGLRANICGYKVFYNPKAIAYHHLNMTVSAMSAKVYFHSTKNKIRTLIKNYETKNLVRYIHLLKIATIGDIILRDYKMAKLKGVFWNLWNLKDSFNERRKIQKLRKLKDKDVFPLFSKKLFKAK